MQLLYSAAFLLASSLIAIAGPIKRSSTVVFAPYLDATTNYDPTPYFQSTGTKHFTLAFVTADGSGNPQWNGYSVTSKFYADKIAKIRAFGGDVSISFGGAAGTELGLVATSASALAATYLNVLNTYGVTWADFDIEGSASANHASVDLRNKAIAILQAQNPNIKISYTLAVQTTGLTSDGVYLIQNAASNKVRVDILNLMIMDYYEGIPYFDANGNSLMGKYGIQATQGAYNQVGSLVGSFGMCAMIGINDDRAETFTLADATQVAQFAASTSYVSWVSFWVAGADIQGNSDGRGAASGAFAKAFIAGLGNQQVTTTTTTTKSAATTTTTTTIGGSGSNCFPAWDSTQNYPGGSTVSYNNVNWKNTWWENPGAAPGAANGDGGWVSQGSCGGQGTTTTTTKGGATTTTTTTKAAVSTTAVAGGTSAGAACTNYGALPAPWYGFKSVPIPLAKEE
ncbi:UNVERIFIED_CONTAM: hypothetical protein HDU68_000432 [Siphonaria sp. JEL0065]|nr:hypothetical protein HDU68_000432 [Siphonaria sp. JEL0065]